MAETRTRGPSKNSRGRLLGVYALAALLGGGLGVRGLVPFADQLRHSTSTPLVRVGFALRESNVVLDADDRRALRTDIETLRASFEGEKEALDLVVALRALTSDGQVDWVVAEQSCKALHWPRCDRPALEELRARSRP